MSKRKIYINNTLVTNAYIVEETENLIVCSDIKEEFFGISSLLLEGNSVLCEHIEGNIVKCNVRINDMVYKDIPFNYVISRNGRNKVAINKNTLSKPSQFTEQVEQVKKEETTLQDRTEIVSENILPEITAQIEEKNNIISNLEKELEILKARSRKNKIIEENKVLTFVHQNIKEGVEEYKQKLLTDLFTISEEQANIKNTLIKDTLAELDSTFNEKYLDTVAELRASTKKEIRDYADTFIFNVEKILTEKQNSSIEEIKDTIDSTIKSDLFLITKDLQEKFNVSIDENSSNLYSKLENYKLTLKNELTELLESKDDLVKYTLEKDFSEKILNTKSELITKYIQDVEKNNDSIKQEINEQLYLLNQKIDRKRVEQIAFDSNELVAEAARLLIEEDSKSSNKLKKFKDQLLKDLQKAAEQYTTDANKRMMRYAEMMSGGGSVAAQFANGGTMSGDLNVTGKYLSAGVDLYNIFLSGGGNTNRDDVNTAVASNSANWNTAYIVATSYQSASSTFVTDNFVGSNFLKLSGGVITNNLTVLGNISALGTATFANTIFNTTSALSVVNTGPGPALYVYQASGPYDVASFYDGDGVEVLHVGNAGLGGLGKVGVNESYPNWELTVKGSISATGSIFANNFLSGGVDLLDIFVTEGAESQTLYFTESASTLSISNSNSISLSALDDKEFATAMAIALS
jgi:hypothetical protein